MSSIYKQDVAAYPYPYSTIPEMFQDIYLTHDIENAAAFQRNDSCKGYSSKEFYTAVAEVAAGLREIGVQPGIGFGVLSPSTPWWVMMDMALQSIRSVLVPLFTNLSEENFLFEVDNADIEYLFVHDDEEVPEMFKESYPQFKKIITYKPSSIENTMTLDEVRELGKKVLEGEPDYLKNRIAEVKPEDLASIVYTSGSTGTPKGVEITQANLTHQLKAINIRFPVERAKVSVLSVLPLAHIFQRVISYYYINCACSTYYVEDVKQVARFAKEIKPGILMVVPYMLEKIYASITEKAKQKPLPVKLLLDLAISLARDEDNAENKLMFSFFDKIFYSKVREALGGNIVYLVSGGSALHPRINRFFLNAGIPLFQGYGMTEHSPVISANYRGYNRLGSVGPAFPDVQIKISEEGEVMAKSDSVMLGYHKDPEQSAEVLKDGWLYTGDLGHIDEDGYLYLTGRKKELLKTSTGKYVSPAPIELALSQNRLVENALIIANDRHYVSALLFVDREHLAKALPGGVTENFHQHPRSLKLASGIIKRVNKKLNTWERIQKFIIIPDVPSVENRMLTPTLKLRRDTIEESFKEEIEAMYMVTKVG